MLCSPTKSSTLTLALFYLNIRFSSPILPQETSLLFCAYFLWLLFFVQAFLLYFVSGFLYLTAPSAMPANHPTIWRWPFLLYCFCHTKLLLHPSIWCNPLFHPFFVSSDPEWVHRQYIELLPNPVSIPAALVGFSFWIFNADFTRCFCFWIFNADLHAPPQMIVFD